MLCQWGSTLSFRKWLSAKPGSCSPSEMPWCRDGMFVNCVTSPGTPLTSDEHLDDTTIVTDWLEPSRSNLGMRSGVQRSCAKKWQVITHAGCTTGRAAEADAELARSFSVFLRVVSFSTILDRLRRWILRACSTRPLWLRFPLQAGKTRKEEYQARHYCSGSAEPKTVQRNTLCNSSKSLLKSQRSAGFRFLRVFQQIQNRLIHDRAAARPS